MGMFDSFYVGEQEIQTKSLDNCLQTYHLGDVVPNLSITAVLEKCNFVLIESDHNRTKPKLYALVVYDNLYIDVLCGTPDDQDELEDRASGLLNTYIAHPSLVALKLAQIIKHELQPKYQNAKSKVHNMRSAASDYITYIERSAISAETELSDNAHRAIRRMFGPSDELCERYENGLSFHEYILELAKKDNHNEHTTTNF